MQPAGHRPCWLLLSGWADRPGPRIPGNAEKTQVIQPKATRSHQAARSNGNGRPGTTGRQPTADGRVYRPHVTMAYLRRPDPADVAGWIQANSLLRSPAFAIDRFGLYSSHQTGEGSRDVLEREYRL